MGFVGKFDGETVGIVGEYEGCTLGRVGALVGLLPITLHSYTNII